MLKYSLYDRGPQDGIARYVLKMCTNGAWPWNAACHYFTEKPQEEEIKQILQKFQQSLKPLCKPLNDIG